MQDKIELINRYKKVKINAYLTICFWILGIVIAIIGLILTVIPGIGTTVTTTTNPENQQETSVSKINNNGIIILSTLFAIGVLFAIFSQLFFPMMSKKYLQKINDSNYGLLVNHINKSYGSPFSGSIGLIKQVDWIINFKQESDKQFKDIENYLNDTSTRLQKEKKEQEKLDELYKEEAQFKLVNNKIDNHKKSDSNNKKSTSKSNSKKTTISKNSSKSKKPLQIKKKTKSKNNS